MQHVVKRGRIGAGAPAPGGLAGCASAVQGAYRHDRPSGTCRNFVQRCLSEKGLDVMGWN
jgi:outer membrane lipoprotein SlyB